MEKECCEERESERGESEKEQGKLVGVCTCVRDKQREKQQLNVGGQPFKVHW